MKAICDTSICFINTLVHVRRLDQNYVLKVADFGLSENTYAKSYFRQEQTAGIKLPIKWMAYESLTDGIFSEKTDVVSSRLFKLYMHVFLVEISCIPKVYICSGHLE